MVREKNKKFLFFFLLNVFFPFICHHCVCLVISTTSFIVSPRCASPVIKCHTCPVKDKMKLGFITDIKQGVFLSKTLCIGALVSCDVGRT